MEREMKPVHHDTMRTPHYDTIVLSNDPFTSDAYNLYQVSPQQPYLLDMAQMTPHLGKFFGTAASEQYSNSYTINQTLFKDEDLACTPIRNLLHTYPHPTTTLSDTDTTTSSCGHLYRQKYDRTAKEMQMAPPLKQYCACHLPPNTKQDLEAYILYNHVSEKLVAQATRVFPFIVDGFEHEVYRDSIKAGHENGAVREWVMYRARIVGSRYKQISVTGQAMNTPSAAYESLLNLLHDLHPVAIELAAGDSRLYADGCCSRCKLFQKGKHPEQYLRYGSTPCKRFQPGNR